MTAADGGAVGDGAAVATRTVESAGYDSAKSVEGPNWQAGKRLLARNAYRPFALSRPCPCEPNACEQGLYKPEAVLRSKLKVLEAARFFDAMKDVYQELGSSVPQGKPRQGNGALNRRLAVWMHDHVLDIWG